LLQVLFTAYPGGRSGVALLALRGALGIALLVQGSYCIAESGATLFAWRGLTALAAGALLTIGFLTPIVVTLTACGAAGFEFFLSPFCSANVFDGKLSIALAAVILIGVALLGPGAFSLDARLFGRREIIIPPPSRRTVGPT